MPRDTCIILARPFDQLSLFLTGRLVRRTRHLLHSSTLSALIIETDWEEPQPLGTRPQMEYIRGLAYGDMLRSSVKRCLSRRLMIR